MTQTLPEPDSAWEEKCLPNLRKPDLYRTHVHREPFSQIQVLKEDDRVIDDDDPHPMISS